MKITVKLLAKLGLVPLLAILLCWFRFPRQDISGFGELESACAKDIKKSLLQHRVKATVTLQCRLTRTRSPWASATLTTSLLKDAVVPAKCLERAQVPAKVIMHHMVSAVKSIDSIGWLHQKLIQKIKIHDHSMRVMPHSICDSSALLHKAESRKVDRALHADAHYECGQDAA